MVVGVGALLVLSTDPVRVAELPQRAGLSKEAIVVALRWPERRGYAVVEPGRTATIAAGPCPTRPAANEI